MNAITMFEVGKPATVMQRGEPIQTGVVKRIMKRWLELDDGSRWDLQGRTYPKPPRYTLNKKTLVPGSTAEIQKKAKAHRARDFIAQRCNWQHVRDLSDDASLEIATIIERDDAARLHRT